MAVPILRLRKAGAVPVLLAGLFASHTTSAAESPGILFSDDFEAHAAGQLPGAPWKEETYQSGAVITVDGQHAFSGRQALHVFTPRGAKYRRGYVAIHLGKPLPEAQSGMFGRARVWLDAAPIPLVEAPVHWTLLQGEGRSADDRYNAIYRLGVELRQGTQLMANYETTPPVTTDCKQQSKRQLPVQRWACVEWHMEVATQEMEFWLDGKPVTQVKGSAGPRLAGGRTSTPNGARRRSSTVSTSGSSGTRIPPTTRISG